MAKRAHAIRVKLPRYDYDRPGWRREILRRVTDAARHAGIKYEKADHIEVAVLIYFSKGKGLIIRDVDNLLKHVLDALQGHFGRSKAPPEERLIQNDNQVYRAVLEKRRRPKILDRSAGGKLLVRLHQKGPWP